MLGEGRGPGGALPVPCYATLRRRISPIYTWNLYAAVTEVDQVEYSIINPNKLHILNWY